MRRDHIPAQTAMVARRAEASRTFLYQNEQARKLLADADADRPAAATVCRRHDAGQGGPWKDRALNAEDALKAAYAEISCQRDQIGKLLGRIRDLEIDLPADAVERINAENRTLRLQNRKLTTGNQQLTERIKAARENNRFPGTRIARLEADLAESLLAGQRWPRGRLPRAQLPGRLQQAGEDFLVIVTPFAGLGARCGDHQAW